MWSYICTQEIMHKSQTTTFICVLWPEGKCYEWVCPIPEHYLLLQPMFIDFCVSNIVLGAGIAGVERRYIPAITKITKQQALGVCGEEGKS